MHYFRQGCNVIAYKKNNNNYGMVCAWSVTIDHEHVAMLLGGQSVTGNNLKVGDVVGISALAKGQEDECLKLGQNHSDEVDKFYGIETIEKDSAILIKGAKIQLVAKVIKVEKITDPDDNFVIMEVLESHLDKSKEFLPLEDIIPE
ncbi:MAG: flavin reductase family protein [Bacilli bacterium]|nr:flavin reductase family protein [Bacilli bacterium]